MKNKFMVHPLPNYGFQTPCIVSQPPRSNRSGTTFVKTGDGKVYILREPGSAHLCVDICDTWDCINDNDRRRWAKLAGVPFRDVTAQMAKNRKDYALQANESEIRKAKSLAEKHGFKLVKIE